MTTNELHTVLKSHFATAAHYRDPQQHSITTYITHSMLKTCLFYKSFPPQSASCLPWNWACTGHQVFCFSFICLFYSLLVCGRLSRSTSVFTTS